MTTEHTPGALAGDSMNTVTAERDRLREVNADLLAALERLVEAAEDGDQHSVRDAVSVAVDTLNRARGIGQNIDTRAQEEDEVTMTDPRDDRPVPSKEQMEAMTRFLLDPPAVFMDEREHLTLTEAIRQRDEAVRLLRDVDEVWEPLTGKCDADCNCLIHPVRAFLDNFKEDSTR